MSLLAQMRPCPFCGKTPDATDSLDVLHPITREEPGVVRVWGASCAEPHGGCSAEVLGNGPQDAVDRWNRRVRLAGFEFTAEDDLKVEEWLAGVHRRLLASRPERSLAAVGLGSDEEVYYGAIGGGLTYSFTPTLLGTVVKVTESATGETLDLTRYDEW